MFGYKSLKWLSAIRVVDAVHPGFWEQNGYPVNGWLDGTTGPNEPRSEPDVSVDLDQRAARSLRVVRFDRVQRAAHWVNAALFATLMLTAIPLYFGSLFGVVLPRHLIEQIHLWSGLALPLPIVVSLLGPWGQQMRRDLRRVNYWTTREIRWLRTLGRSPLEADKFNPGQKLNVLFIGATIVVMLVTGSMLQWFRFFSVSCARAPRSSTTPSPSLSSPW